MKGGAVGADALGGGVEGDAVEVEECDGLGLLGGQCGQKRCEGSGEGCALGGAGFGRRNGETRASAGLEGDEGEGVEVLNQRGRGALVAGVLVELAEDLADDGSRCGRWGEVVDEGLARLCGRDVQRVGLSATVGNPEVMLSWLGGSSARPGVVIDPPKGPARREILVVLGESVDDIARDASSMARGRKSLFFCQSRSLTEAVAASMRRAGTDVFVHRSAVSQGARAEAEERFHSGTGCLHCMHVYAGAGHRRP